MYESASVRSTFDSPIQPRIKREVSGIIEEVVTWTDIITYVLVVVVLTAATAIGMLHYGLSKLRYTLQTTTRRSKAELEQLMKEQEGPPEPISKAAPVPKKRVTFEPLVTELSAGQPRGHPLIPLPFWSDARPTPPAPESLV